MADRYDEVDYFLLRARQEHEQAASARKPEAAAAHRELAMRYSVKALQSKIFNDDAFAESADSDAA